MLSKLIVIILVAAALLLSNHLGFISGCARGYKFGYTDGVFGDKLNEHRVTTYQSFGIGW